jgi:ubiquinone/menaquinone biosynthesis C-methylase UbiE
MTLFPYYRRSFRAMRRMYNRIYRFYGRIEKVLNPKIDKIIAEKIIPLPNKEDSSVLEYACGSGLLSLKLAPYFKSVTARDLSTGMLRRAKERAKQAGVSVDFSEGDILAITEQAKSYDYVFVSFALHLFPLETEKEILRKLYTVAKKAVIIIDHGRTWSFSSAITEWIEGGYYDKFIQQDFKPIANEFECRSFQEDQIENCTVLIFYR